jgi:hypothetical protein
MYVATILSYGFNGNPDDRWKVNQLLEMQDGSTNEMVKNLVSGIYGWENASPKFEMINDDTMKITSDYLNQVIMARIMK